MNIYIYIYIYRFHFLIPPRIFWGVGGWGFLNNILKFVIFLSSFLFLIFSLAILIDECKLYSAILCIFSYKFLVSFYSVQIAGARVSVVKVTVDIRMYLESTIGVSRRLNTADACISILW